MHEQIEIDKYKNSDNFFLNFEKKFFQYYNIMSSSDVRDILELSSSVSLKKVTKKLYNLLFVSNVG